MINVYLEGELDPSEYEGVITNLVASGGGFVHIDGMTESDFGTLQSTFSTELSTNVIKAMSWVALNGEFQAIV